MPKDLGGDGYCDDVPGVSRGVSAAAPEASMLGASEEASLPSAGEDQSYGRLVFAGSRQGRSFRGTRQRYFGGSRGHLSKHIWNIVAVVVPARVFEHRIIIRVGRRDPSHWLCGVLVRVRTRRGIPSVRTGMWMLCVLISIRIRCLKTWVGTVTVTMFPVCLEGCPQLPPKHRCLVPRKKRLCRLPVKTSRMDDWSSPAAGRDAPSEAPGNDISGAAAGISRNTSGTLSLSPSPSGSSGIVSSSGSDDETLRIGFAVFWCVSEPGGGY
eukprot:jgi/Undpi1/8002/HiC_scaffold_24.g10474.m1